MRMLRPLVLASCALLGFCAYAIAQQPSNSSVDPQAAQIIQKALAALNGSSTITDVTLTGTATRTAGSDVETGTITLKALGAKLSRIDMDLSGRTWTELRGADSKGLPKSEWYGPDGKAHPVPGQNAMTDAVWFFPSLSSLSKSPSSNPYLVISYVAQEQRNGAPVQHIRFITQFPYYRSADPKGPPGGPPQLAPLTAMDMYIDATSALPVSLTFNTHADNNAFVNIPVDIEFSSYQRVNGVLVPTRIQKFQNGTLLLDITIASANINTGLSATNFVAQ